MNDKVTCEICNHAFRRITRTHLKKHNITTAEYLTLYPNSSIICKSLRYECGKYFREHQPMHNPIYREQVASAHRGRAKTDEHKKKLSEAQLGEKHHMWGKKRPEHSEHMKEIMPAIMKKLYEDGRPGNNKGKTLNLTPEQRQAISNRSKGKIKWPNGNPNKGKTLNLTPEQRLNRSIKSSVWLSKNQSKSKDTNIELQFKDWCNSGSVDYQHQYLLICKNTSWLFDFYIPQLHMLVEVDGEYWHSSKKQINRDQLKERNAIDAGFKFCRISSTAFDCSIVLQDYQLILQHNLDIIDHRKSKHC